MKFFPFLCFYRSMYNLLMKISYYYYSTELLFALFFEFDLLFMKISAKNLSMRGIFKNFSKYMRTTLLTIETNVLTTTLMPQAMFAFTSHLLMNE